LLQSFFFPLKLTYFEYAVETVTVTILKHGGEAEITIPVNHKDGRSAL